MPNKHYTVSDDTRKFLDVLDKYAEFKELYYSTLIEEYGEVTAEERYNDLYDKFAVVEDEIFSEIRNLMVCHMGMGKTEIEI